MEIIDNDCYKAANIVLLKAIRHLLFLQDEPKKFYCNTL